MNSMWQVRLQDSDLELTADITFQHKTFPGSVGLQLLAHLRNTPQELMLSAADLTYETCVLIFAS